MTSEIVVREIDARDIAIIYFQISLRITFFEGNIFFIEKSISKDFVNSVEFFVFHVSSCEIGLIK